MNSFKNLMITLVLIASVLVILGSEGKGEAEKADGKLDKAMEQASKKTSDLSGK